MNKIIFISTIHKENGCCNSEELYKILTRIKPEVIFLEALEDTYSKYQEMLFSTYNQFHQKLEIKAIQLYSLENHFLYIPVLDKTTFNIFDKQNEIVCENEKFQLLIDNYSALTATKGFKFLNSDRSIYLEEEMRVLGNQIINNKNMENQVDLEIRLYEESMLKNITSYCKNNSFQTAVFMCGVAHRKSINEKIEKYNQKDNSIFIWEVYNG